MSLLAIAGLVTAQLASAPPPPPPTSPAPTQELAAPQSWRPRRFGLHLGLNATLAFDVSLGSWFYGGVATHLLGLGAIGDSSKNFTVSALFFGGVGIPLVESSNLRFTADVTPMLSYIHAEPVNLLSVGLLAGVRVVHRSGFTFAVKLPLVGFAGSPDAQRGSLLYYYISAIPTVPVITFGYSF